MEKSDQDKGPLLANYGQYGQYSIVDDFDNGAFTKLVVELTIVAPDLVQDAIYQSYLQIQDPTSSETLGSVTFEDFVCGIKYDYMKFGRVDGEHVW